MGFSVDQGYDVKVNSWCTPYRESFESLSEAKQRCNDDPSCAVVYDDGGKHTHFVLCGWDATIKHSSSGSLLHTKRSKYMFNWALFLIYFTNNIKIKLKCIKLYIFLQKITASCACKDFVNSGGHGNCQTASQSNDHHGRKMCYVVQPSTCKDLVNSNSNPGEQFSEEACDGKGATHNYSCILPLHKSPIFDVK